MLRAPKSLRAFEGKGFHNFVCICDGPIVKEMLLTCFSEFLVHLVAYRALTVTVMELQQSIRIRC